MFDRRKAFKLLMNRNSFDPLSVFSGGIAGGWYDPSDLTTMFQDTAGTVPITADGQAVARINDKSGNNKHLTQATGANCPLYKTSSGLHWLLFDGTNDSLFNVSPIAGGTQSICAAVQTTNGASTVLANIISASDRVVLTDTTVAIIAGYYNGSAYTPKSGAANASAHVDTVEIIKGTSTELRVNSVAQVGTTNPSVGSTAGIYLGQNSIGANFMAGKFFGLLQAAKGLTSAERASLETYMGAKAGIVL